MDILNAPVDTPAGNFQWSDAIDHLGSDKFSGALVGSLDSWAGVEHCSAFALSDDALQLIAAGSIRGSGAARAMGALYANGDFWRRDPTIDHARDASRDGTGVGLRLSPIELPDERMRQLIFLDQQICDRVFLCGERDGRWYGFSMLRTRDRGRFDSIALDRIGWLGDSLLSLVAKQHRLTSGASASFDLLRSVPDIEDRLRGLMPALSGRETQVCARILRGISTPGIAIDLKLQEDSVATYRKRAYRRLAIGTRFELMQLFLSTPSAAPALMRH